MPSLGALLSEPSPAETTIQVRLEELEAAYSCGMSPRECQRHFSERWGITRRQVRTYLARVRRNMLEQSAKEESVEARRESRARVRNSYREILRETCAAEKWKEALVACDGLVRIDQLQERTDAEKALQGKAMRPLKAATTTSIMARLNELKTTEGR